MSWNILLITVVLRLLGHAPRERVSWNCNKYIGITDNEVTLHVSVWVEIPWNFIVTWSAKSRSTWACELKYFSERQKQDLFCHAPRERVSWNRKMHIKNKNATVTLHVSVWVEIIWSYSNDGRCKVTLHVSVWVEIKINLLVVCNVIVTLHVSVWVEIYYSQTSCLAHLVTLHVSVWVEIKIKAYKKEIDGSRSTWACELKFVSILFPPTRNGHAPRERVSWNVTCVLGVLQGRCHAPRERVSWNSDSWRCYRCQIRHAPRERVSWNLV